MPVDSLVEVRDLRYRYPGSHHDVLRIPFLDVGGRGLIAITGPSGAGKSTLVELLAGTLREQYEGSVQVLGEEWKEFRRDADRQRHLRRVGLIPQDFGLLPSRTPRETLTQDLSDAEFPRDGRAERIDRALTSVELTEMADRRIAELSGGQRQRVAIARMLARDVDLVIADEPTANLDPGLVAATVALFRELAERIPVIVVTHDPEVAALCDRTIVLQGSVPDAPRAAVAEPPRRGRRRWPIAAVALVVVAALVLTGVALAALVGNSKSASGSPPTQHVASSHARSSTTSTGPARALKLTQKAQGNYSVMPYPASWTAQNTESSESGGAYYDTTIAATAHPNTFVSLDVTPGKTPAAKANALSHESGAETLPGYDLVAWHGATIVSHPAWVWGYVVNENGVRVHKVETFFNTGTNSYVYLEQAPQSAWSQVKPTLDAMFGKTAVA